MSPIFGCSRLRRLAILALIVLLLGGSMLVYRRVPQPFFLGGIQVNEPDHQAWVDALERSGLNTVAITVYAKQGDWDSTNLWFEEEEPWVVGEAVVAKASGLRVVLVLRVALDHAFARNKFFWHGMIMPEADSQVERWFERYGEFVLKWARIAEDVGIDVLAVGSELNALTNTLAVDELPALEEYWSNQDKVAGENAKVLTHKREIENRQIWVRGSEGYDALEPYLEDRSAAHARWARRVTFLGEANPLVRVNARRRLLDAQWRELIGRTREVYSGALTYAANFDQYRDVGFWEELDLIGINAYFPLRERDLPVEVTGGRVDLFASRWSTILQEIDGFRRQQGIPGHRVLFTELGYVRRANCTIQPWAAHGFAVLPSAQGPKLMIWEDQPEDSVERAEAVRALYRANLDFGGDMLAGILYWKLSTEPAHRDVEPFVLLIGERADDDPLLGEMRRFGSQLRFDLWKRRILSPFESAFPGS